MDPLIMIGQAAQQFNLADLSGERYALTDYLGWITILNFWSAECDWCSQVDEEMFASMKTWKDRVKVVWIASNANEGRDLIERVARDRKLTTVLLDIDHRVADLYGAQTTPHFFIINEKGILVYQGAWDDKSFRQRVPTQKYVPQVVEALLTSQPPPITQTQPYGCVLVRYIG